MIKYTFLLFIVFLSHYSFGQDFKRKDERQYYDNGQLMVKGQYHSKYKYLEPHSNSDWLKDGKWVYYYSNGNIWMEGYYQKNEMIDLWTAYYPNGKIYIQGKYEQYFTDLEEYINDSENRYVKSVGLWKSYWNDGRVANEYTFDEEGTIFTKIVNTQHEPHLSKKGGYGVGEMALSIKTTWNWQKQPFIDILESTFTMKYGEITSTMGNFTMYGEWKDYYDDGTLASVGMMNWKNNKRVGVWKSFHKNGVPSGFKTYNMDGERDGKYEVRNEKGTLRESGNYVKAWLEGKITSWNDDGELTNIWDCKKGKCISTNYRPNGSVLSSGPIEYVEDEKKYLKEGDWVSYFENGKVKDTIRYKEGEINLYIAQFLKDGTQSLKNGNGIYYFFHKNGKESTAMELSGGSRHGTTTWYYDDGQKRNSIKYIYDAASKPFGLRWEAIDAFDREGNPINAGTCKNGNGTLPNFNDKDELVGFVNYVNGIEISEWSAYDQAMKDFLEKYDLKKGKKRILVLSFSKWCGPCMRQIEAMVAEDKFENLMEVVVIEQMSKSVESIKSYFAEKNISFEGEYLIWDRNKASNELSDIGGSLPMIIFLDEKNNYVFKSVGQTSNDRLLYYAELFGYISD